MSNYQDRAIASGHTFDKLLLGQAFHTNATYDVKQADDNAIKGIARTPGVARPYVMTINFADSNLSTCSCGYYLNYKNGGVVNRTKLCSHQIGMLIHCDNGQITVEPPPEGERKARAPRSTSATTTNATGGSTSTPGQYSFAAKMKRRIGDAIEDIADQLLDKLDAGKHAVMVGPTGCGKTGAVDMLLEVLERRGEIWGIEDIAGLESYGDADLFGIRIPGSEDVEGVISRAFRRARDGEHILLFIDELLRFDSRVQNAFMRAVQPISIKGAAARGIETDEPIYITEAPIWGRIYAPVSRIKWVFGCNPWGARVDTAFSRRVDAIFVDYAPEVVNLIDDTELKELVSKTHEAVRDGLITLPIEYQQLSNMKNGHDRSIIFDYMNRLKFLDMAEFMQALGWLPQAERELPQFAKYEVM